MRLLALICCLFAATPAFAEPVLSDLAFLEGDWRGESDGLGFDETWSSPAAGVMTGMARGYREGQISVLEYIVVEEKDGAVLMRFMHFRPDYTTWETEGPVVLRLTQARKGDALFQSDDPQAEVQSVRYLSPSEGVLRTDVGLLADGKPGGFSLTFDKAD